MAISKKSLIYFFVVFIIYQIDSGSCQNDYKVTYEQNSTSTTNTLDTIERTFRTYRPLITKPAKKQNLGNTKFTFARLLIVFILSFSIIATIILLTTQNCQKIWRKYKQSRYKHFKEYNEDDTAIDGLHSSNLGIYNDTTSSIAFRTDTDNVQFSPDYYEHKPSFFSKLVTYIKRKRGNSDHSDRMPVILESESDRIPDSIYRKYEKKDYKDDPYVDYSNNIQPNPFIVHLM